jgi:hypothetical protein
MNVECKAGIGRCDSSGKVAQEREKKLFPRHYNRRGDDGEPRLSARVQAVMGNRARVASRAGANSLIRAEQLARKERESEQ